MKIISSIIVLMFSSLVWGQLTIGKPSVTNSSVIMEFGDDGNRGLILPYTQSELANAANGTFIFDTSVNRVKVKLANGWKDLSNQNGNSNTLNQLALPDNPDASVSLGDNPTTADGVLVLEATDQAMVLPIVEHYTDIVNPSPGMIVYVRTNKRLAIFNGSKWTFWKSANH